MLSNDAPKVIVSAHCEHCDIAWFFSMYLFFDILLNIVIAEEFKFSSQNDKNVTKYQNINMIYLAIQYVFIF